MWSLRPRACLTSGAAAAADVPIFSPNGLTVHARKLRAPIPRGADVWARSAFRLRGSLVPPNGRAIYLRDRQGCRKLHPVKGRLGQVSDLEAKARAKGLLGGRRPSKSVTMGHICRTASRALAPGRSGCRGSGSSELTGNGLRSPGAGGPGLPSEQVGPRSAASCRRVSCSLKSAAERAGDRD